MAMSAIFSLDASPPHDDQRAQEILGVQDADDVVRIAPPQRQARIGRFDRLAHHLLRRQVGVDEPHLGPVDHHVADRHLRELEQAAEHVAVGALDLALAVQDVDRAHQLLVARDTRIGLGQRQAAEPQHEADHRLDRERRSGRRPSRRTGPCGAIASETRSG